MNNQKKYKLYILMRNDLPSLNPGKAMAQACHAANQFIHQWGTRKKIREWQKEGCGFGTTIVVSSDYNRIKRLNELFMDYSYPELYFGLTIDDTYPYIVNTEIASLIPKDTHTSPPIYKDDGQVVMFRNELTCAYLFVEDGSDMQREFVGDLPLCP